MTPSFTPEELARALEAPPAPPAPHELHEQLVSKTCRICRRAAPYAALELCSTCYQRLRRALARHERSSALRAAPALSKECEFSLAEFHEHFRRSTPPTRRSHA